MGHSFYLSDIIEKAGLPKNEVAVVRHTLGDKNANRAWKAGLEFFEEYQRIQPKDYFCKKNYIFSFVNDNGTTRFLGVYEVLSIVPIKDVKPMKDYPLHQDYSKKDLVYYNLKKLDVLEDLQRRLVIEWGTGTRKIVQHKWETISKKAVVSIDAPPEDGFPGYEKVVWSFNQMANYVNNPEKYQEVYEALSKVNGVYLILDPVDNKQYVGSASGSEGIYGRWKTYAKTEGKGGNDEEGANKKLSLHLNKNKKRYLELQFSILAVLYKTGNDKRDKDAAIELEQIYKDKLGSRNPNTGLNLN